MAKGLKIEVTGLDMFKDINSVIYGAVKDCMDDIKEDAIKTASGSAPVKTGKLEKSYYVRSKNVELKRCDFSLSFKAVNKGFNYAVWTHDATYKLGAKSRAKQPPKSRFAKGTLRVGNKYLTNMTEASQDNWKEFIQNNVSKKMRASIKKNSRTKMK